MQFLDSRHYWKPISLWMLFLAAILPFLYIPWFDEVFMSTISSSFLQTGKLNLTLAVNGNEAEILTYGPVTFWIQSAFFYLFGESLTVGRLVNLIFGFGLFLLVYRWVKTNITTLSARLVLLFILTDMAILTTLMCGRLDFISVFLFCAALFIFLKNRNYISLVLSGILFASAFLCSPRIGIYLAALAPFFVVESISQKNFRKNIVAYGILFITFCIPVGIWIFTKLGSIDAYIKNYTENPLIVEHVGSGSTSWIPKPYQAIPLLLIVALLIYRVRNRIKIPQTIWLFITIIAFHLVVIKEVGPYSGMMMPFVYIVLALLLDKQILQKFKILKYVMGFYFLGMLGMVLLKTSIMFSNFQDRIPTDFKAQVSDSINPKQKPKVLASYSYYYILKDLNVDFKSFDYNFLHNLITPADLRSFDYVIVNAEGLKQLKKMQPDTEFDEMPIGNAEKNNLPSFLKAFQNDYNGYLITFKNKKDNG
ncbi:ArnT family glycosyltransferase [Flavobacterium sp.]